MQGGYYKAYNYNQVKNGKNFAADLTYFFTNKFFICSFYSYGESWYLENTMPNLINNYDYGNGTNAEISNILVGLTLGYQQKIFKILKFSGQLGIRSYTEVNTFSFQYENHIGPFQTAFTDLTFPIKLGIGLNVIDWRHKLSACLSVCWHTFWTKN